MSSLTLTHLPVEILLYISDFIEVEAYTALPFVNRLFWEISGCFSARHLKNCCHYLKLKGRINNTKLSFYLMDTKIKNLFFEKLGYALLKFDFSTFSAKMNQFKLPSIMCLNCDAQRYSIEGFQKFILQCSRLKELIFTYQDPLQMNQLAPFCTNIKKLHLHGSLWKKLTIWPYLKHLKEISIHGSEKRNTLSMIDLKDLTELKKIFVSHAHLTCPNVDYTPMTQLHHLTLDNVTIKQDSLLMLPRSLTSLTLENSTNGGFECFVQTLHLQQLHQLTEINLANFNPILALANLPPSLKRLNFRIKPPLIDYMIQKLYRFTALTSLESLQLKGSFLPSQERKIKQFMETSLQNLKLQIIR